MNHKFTFNKEEFTIKIWNNERLGNLIAIDTETDFVPFHMTPEIATMQVYAGKDEVYYVPLNKINLFFNAHYDSVFLAHNAPFDLDVLSLHLGKRDFSYDLIDRKRMLDTQILYKLLHLATAGFIPFKSSLAELGKRFLGVELDKDDAVRCNFFQFKTIEEIPSNFLEYGAIDVIATMQIYLTISGMMQTYDKYNTLLSHQIQIKGALALLHTYKNGIGFDLEKRDEWLLTVDSEMDKHADILASWGWVRGLKGIKDRMESILDMLGIKSSLPTTESGDVSTKGEDLEPYDNEPFIYSYLEYQRLEKAKSFVADISSTRIHPRYNLLVNTGRTSCAKPNFQQLPRMGGIREMFKASEGNTLLITDYSTVELATLAQVMYDRYGESVMKDKINDGIDLHKYYASVMNNCKVEEVTKDMRQQAKAANFGYPGGLGTTTFRTFAKGYGLVISESEARIMKDVWHDAFPETRKYLTGEKGEVYTITGRKRGNTTFCAEKNTPFQGLAADGAKIALYNLDKQGFKIVGFVHDEIISEVPSQSAGKRIKEQEQIMIDSMREVVKDVEIRVESMISEHYTK